MKDYSDLVKRLRHATALPVLQDLCDEAADVIEGLVHQHQLDLSETKQVGRWLSALEANHD